MTIKEIWIKAKTLDKIILCIYIFAFIGATYNHINDLIRGGLFPYTKWWNVPLLMNIYWTLLTILDPVAIILLLMSSYIGCIFYIIIMTTDVAINLYANIVYWKQPLIQSYGLIMQTAFLIFILATVGRILKHLKMQDNDMI